MIDLLDINPERKWPLQKQEDFRHLKVLHSRMMAHPADVTNEFADFNTFAKVYARYSESEESFNMLKEICKKSDAYNEEKVESGFVFFSRDNKLKSNKLLFALLEHYSIDTSNPDKATPITDASELAAYLPAGVDPHFALEWGFYPLEDKSRTGYYFKTNSEKTSFAAQSNFIIKPLMHVYSKVDNKRIIEITNGFNSCIIDVPSRNLISVEGFSSSCYEEGNFLFYGNKTHLFRILQTINNKFTVCTELKTLGWQPQGFFAWSNVIYNEKQVVPYDDLGIVQHKEINYYSPSISSIYANLKGEDDEYENDRYLYYKPPPFGFEEWCRLMHMVYPEHSVFGIAFVWIGLFKDLIFKMDNNCPMLSCYGEKGSGKSKFCESISAIFLNDLQPFNLNHGTDFAFFHRLARFRNCVTWFDEFDDQAIKEDRFQSIKGAFDGAGRERGKGTNKNRTEISRINSALLLSGQYLSTRDDNAALSRCIILPFTPNDNRTSQQIADYDKLKSAEKTGLSGILPELLAIRKEMETSYPKMFPEIFKHLRDKITERKGQFKERVLRNYTAVACLYKIISPFFKLPFSYDYVEKECLYHIQRLSRIMSESDSLADFWNTMEYLADVKTILEGVHYTVETVLSIKVLDNDKKEKLINFKEPTRLLYFRLNTIHKLYQESYRRQNGKTGIDFQSLILYMTSQAYFVGAKKSWKFKEEGGGEKVTSCHIINLDLIPLNLGSNTEETDNVPADILIGTLDDNPTRIERLGKTVEKFRFSTTPSYEIGEKEPKKAQNYTCYYADLRNSQLLTSNRALKLTGKVQIKSFNNMEGEKVVKRIMDVDLIELANPEEPILTGTDSMPF